LPEIKDIPDAARFMLAPGNLKRFVELYRKAKATKDERIISSADDAMKYFRDAESALIQMLGAEATVREFLSE
jgi:hypothetical protein